MRESETCSRPQARRMRGELTRAETILWRYLKGRQLHGHAFRRQHPVGRYIADFACVSERLVVEVDGATHSTDKEVAHDAKRTAYMESEGWKVLRVGNLDVYENLDGVILAIENELPPPTAAPPPPP